MRTVGLPLMHKEPGERRDFLPEFITRLDEDGASEIVLEHGYGSGMGIAEQEYRNASPKVRFADYDSCLSQELVVVLRCPSENVFERLPKGGILLSMLHFPTRPGRVEKLLKLGVHGVSLDGLVDDRGRRFVENLQSVGWNGVREAFKEIAKLHPCFEDPGRRPIRATVLGAGAVGSHAITAATRYGDPKLRESMVARSVPGVEVTVIDYDLTGIESYMLDRLGATDLLIDATQRPDPTSPVIPNPWLEALPQKAVMVDLSVDPYDFSTDPPQVKGIEGVPEGSLDQWIFHPDDPAYDRIDPRIDTTNRRVALSCYSWPGIYPRDCMELYGTQIAPMTRVLLERDIDELDENSSCMFERAVARAEVSRWKKANSS